MHGKMKQLIMILIMTAITHNMSFAADVVLEQDTMVERTTAEYSVRMVSLGYRLNKPPFMESWYDVDLKNSSDKALWFVIGNEYGIGNQGHIRSIQLLAYKFCGEGCSAIYQSVGENSFYAVKVPAGGKVTIRKLPLKIFRAEHDTTIVKQLNAMITVCHDISLQRKSINDWLSITEPTMDKSVEGVWSFVLPQLASRNTVNSKPVRVHLKKAEHLILPASVRRKTV